jgi:hypothetical protein
MDKLEIGLQNDHQHVETSPTLMCNKASCNPSCLSEEKVARLSSEDRV